MEAVIIEETNRTDGVTIINGREFLTDAKGGYVPLHMVKAQHKLEDETVRRSWPSRLILMPRSHGFRDHTMLDLGTFDALLAQEYGAKIGGAKGNRTIRPSTA